MASHPEQQTEHLPESIRGLLNTPYAEYLGLDQLFSIQDAKSASAELHHPEEVIFRSVHLSSELWLRLAGYEIERATAALAPEKVFAGARLVRRSRMSLDRFRTLHLQIAQRFLGETTQGTGGQGIPYLRENLAQRLFPRLWALRGRIAEASGAAAYGYGVPDHNSE
jgi:tryptophan 2,3-dioxygenase